jgi:hypothetical protein
MGAWTLVADVVGVVVTALLMLALRYAAIERGQIHRAWARLPRERGRKVSQSIDWCMSLAAPAGCV